MKSKVGLSAVFGIRGGKRGKNQKKTAWKGLEEKKKRRPGPDTGGSSQAMLREQGGTYQKSWWGRGLDRGPERGKGDNNSFAGEKCPYQCYSMKGEALRLQFSA